ncbi:MAG TPA: entericidin A/B family lipoprotein [Phenylobacterium sp.]|nr:entericidin A/B family lipoprotein [Phenylobacterium sp.]
MRKIVLLMAFAASMAAAACNTVEGAGRDVSAAGKAVSNTAEDAKH